jgi:hypothetical protein
VGGEPGFKARAGALTLFYSVSDVDRDYLRAMLAEVATGVRIQDEPPEDHLPDVMEIFQDSYVLEPADPDLPAGTSIGPDTLLQPTPAGREMLFVVSVLQHWLNIGPAGPVEIGEEAGPLVWGLLSGWSSTLTHALAAGALSAEEATGKIGTLDPPVVRLVIETMLDVGLIEAVPDDGQTRYEVGDWLRAGIAPLAAAARMELRHPLGDTAPIAVADVEAGLRLVLALLRLPVHVSGSCAMAVELDDEVAEGPVGVTARVAQGRVVSVSAGLDEDADARAVAPIAIWLDAVIEGAQGVELSGKRQLAKLLVGGLNRALFG